MTTDERLSVLERDLSRTKTANRILVLVLAGVALVAYGTATAQATAPQVSQAVYSKAFVLVDDENKPRGSMTMVKGEPKLGLLTASGKTTAMMSPQGYSLMDGEGKPLISLARVKGGSTLQLSDERGRVMALVGALSTGGGMSVYDKNEREAWIVP